MKQKRKRSRRRGVCFVDIDGTLVRGQLWVLFITELVYEGLLPRIVLTAAEGPRRAWIERTGPFSAYVEALLKSFKSNKHMKGVAVADVQVVARRVVERYGNHLHVFPRQLILAAQDIGMVTAMITGTPTEVVRILAPTLGVTDFLGTEWPEVDGAYTWDPPKEWCVEKGNACCIIAKRNRCALQDSVAIGDTSGDILMLKEVGVPICFNPDQKLLSWAREHRVLIVLERKDVHVLLRPDASGLLHETSLDAVMPQDLASALSKRLKSVNW